MDILKNNWDSPLEYLFNKYYFKKIRNHIQYLQFFLKNNTNVYVNKILFNPFISIPFINSFLNPKIQMEHSHLIVEPNVALNFFLNFFDLSLYDNNNYELLEGLSKSNLLHKNV
jgi:hypothetical protein